MFLSENNYYKAKFPKRFAPTQNIIITDHIPDCEIISPPTLTFISFITDRTEETKDSRLTFLCDKPGSNIKCIIIFIGTGSGKLHFETISSHLVPHTSCDIKIRSCLTGSSSIDYTGKIEIAKGAIDTSSFLHHDTLILSEQAKVRTLPSLEIEEDDVKAGHGATVGGPDEDILFYMNSRGIDKTMALNLLSTGFLGQDLSLVSDTTVRRTLTESISSLFHKYA